MQPDSREDLGTLERSSGAPHPAAYNARMSLLATVREALRGTKQDFTDGPIGRSLVLLAVPMVLETVLESLFAVVDIFFVAHLGADFTRVVMGGNVAVLLLFLINAVFRGAGDATIAMRSLWLASACNMVLGPMFIFGVGPFPRLGLTGAAVGTTIGRSIGVLFQISQLARRDGRIVIRARHLRPDPRVVWQLVRLSGSGVLQLLIG